MAESLRRNPAAAWRHLDLGLMAVVVAIAGLGMLMVYSATEAQLDTAGLDPMYYLKRQVVFVVIGVAAMTLTALVDYRVFRDFAPFIFVGTVLLLIAVLTPLGSSSRTNLAFFQLGPYQLQPSEFAKLAMVLCLAAYCAMHRGELDRHRLGTALALASVLAGLVYQQGDLGTAMVFLAVVTGTLLVAGARPRHLAVLGVMGLVGILAYVQLGRLEEYQIERLTSFLDQEGDVAGANYNLDQSQTAIGAGGVFGRGLFEGTQTNLSLVPEQHTDFIFTAVGEQLGFAGAATLLLLYGFLVWRIWRAAVLAKDFFGTLVCVGVLSMLVFQVFENVGMTMGIMPITGIPLPFMSYGGSSTIAAFMGVGFVLNVHMRRFT